MAPEGGQLGLSKTSAAGVGILTALVVLAANLGVRHLSLGNLQIPASALPLVPLVMASLGATLGPSFGCYMAFRRPDPHSMAKFLVPGLALTAMGIGLEVARFAGTHHHRGALAIGASQGLLAIAVVLPALLWRVAAETNRH